MAVVGNCNSRTKSDLLPDALRWGYSLLPSRKRKKNLLLQNLIRNLLQQWRGSHFILKDVIGKIFVLRVRLDSMNLEENGSVSLDFYLWDNCKDAKKIRKCKPGTSERYRKMSKKCLCNSQYCSPQHTGRNRLVHKSSSYFNSIHKNKRDWRNLNKIIDIKNNNSVDKCEHINANDYLMIRMRFIPIPRLKQNLPINKYEWWILFALITKPQNYSLVLTHIKNCIHHKVTDPSSWGLFDRMERYADVVRTLNTIDILTAFLLLLC